MIPRTHLFRWMTVLFVICIVNQGFARTGSGEAVTPASGRLDLQKVVLFNNGVGYFELKGTVPASEEVALHFKPREMNDVLKSLVVLNLSGGAVNSMVYDNTKTIDQQLRSLGFEFAPTEGLPGLLRQFQGSDIEIVAGTLNTSGRILSVEKRMVMDDTLQKPEFFLSLMTPQNTLRTFHMADITSLRFYDEQLNRLMAQYLTITSQKHQKNKKSVIIRPTGSGPHDLLVGYVTEAPVWKATYRIVIPEKNPQKKLFIQGWAIVDNVTDDDWESVHLSLMSGMPVSFIQNLYDPRFKARPMLKTDEDLAVTPTIPESGMDKEQMKAPAPMARQGHKAPVGMALEKTEANFEKVGEGMRNMTSQTTTRSIGELFEYKITHPVSIAKDHSALVSIVSKDIEGEPVDLYNAKTRAQNPLAGVRLENTTGLTLEEGPLTVISGDCYAGEAFIRTIKPNETRYITYAVDLSVQVNTKRGSKTEAIDRVIINQGMIRMHRGILETKTYHLNNHNDQRKTVVIEHPYHPGWRLLNTIEPIETTENYLRFEIKAPPNTVTSFTVKEMRDSWESMRVENVTPDDVLLFIRKGYLEDSTEAQFQQVITLKSEISDLNQQLASLEQEHSEIFKDQKRLRKNLRSLGTSMEEKGLRSRYIKQLGKQETRLKAIGQKEKELRTIRDAKQARLKEQIMALAQDLQV